MKRQFILRIAAVLFACMMLCAFASCDKLFIPGDVPDGPSPLLIKAESGERTAERLGYFWEKRKTEVKTSAEEVDPLSVDYDRLIVQPGEKIRLIFTEGFEPHVISVKFYPADGEGGYGASYHVETEQIPEGAENADGAYGTLTAPEDDGIFVVEALWPVWVNSGVRANVTYAFAIYSAKG